MHGTPPTSRPEEYLRCERQRRPIDGDVRRHVDESITVGLAALKRDTRVVVEVLRAPFDAFVDTIDENRLDALAQLAERTHRMVELVTDAHNASIDLAAPITPEGCTR